MADRRDEKQSHCACAAHRSRYAPADALRCCQTETGPCGSYLLFRSVLTLRSRYARTRLRQCEPGLSRREVHAVVSQCETCQAIDPAPVKWKSGALEVDQSWKRLAIDITHHGRNLYLSVVDCGPSRFSLWRLLRRGDSAHVVEQLHAIFNERGAPEEILADNDTAFRSRVSASFASRWGIRLRFRAAYRPSGNGIVERNHRTVKVIAARSKCSISDAVHLYNVSPRDDYSPTSTPAQEIYQYPVRDSVRRASNDPLRDPEDYDTSTSTSYANGDSVWTRTPGTRCGETSRPGHVTALVSPQVVDVDSMPWHVRDVRRRETVLR